MKTVAIVGFGRFGEVLYRLLKDDFNLILFNRHPNVFIGKDFPENVKIVDQIKNIYQADVIFYAVSISSFESVIKKHKKYFKENHLLIDVLSVKMHPEKVFKKYLKGLKTQVLLTHPMFGPDSSHQGFSGLPMVLDRFKTDEKNLSFWKNFFAEKGLRIVEMKAEEHDSLAANSQGITHFIGRLLDEYHLKPTLIDTLGVKKLHEVIEQTCNDTWELFTSLQRYNPYTKTMRIHLGQSYDKLYNKLLPKRIDSHHVIYGIQGGVGSFNEEAILFYTDKNKIKNFKIKYLYTTEKVLRNLHQGNIDFGLFVIQNAVGGVVAESAYAMARYRFKIIEEFTIPVRHFLMKRKDVETVKIDRIIAHPQVFAQCKKTLVKKYPHLIQESGKGDLIDTARAAESLAKGKIPGNYAILGPQSLSKLYNFEVIDENLQDSKENDTSFFLVSR